MLTKFIGSLSIHTIIKNLTTLTALVSLGVIVHTAIMGSVINDDEYISGSRDNYQIQECTYRFDNTGPDSIGATLTPKQIEKKIYDCEINASKDIISRRRYKNKTTLVSASIRFIFALIIYVINNGYIRSKS